MVAEPSILERYVQSLYKVAKDAGKLEKISADFVLLLQLLNNMPDLFKYLSAPIISFYKLQKFIEVVSKKFNFDEVTMNFLLTLGQNKRLVLLKEIIIAFTVYAKEQTGLIEVKVKSAAVLSDKQLTDIQLTIEKQLEKKVELNSIVDPLLLGGLIIQIGSIEVDNSVANRLNRFKFNAESFY